MQSLKAALTLSALFALPILAGAIPVYADDSDGGLVIPSTCASVPDLDEVNRVNDPSQYRPEDFTQWFMATDPANRKGTAMVVHGLNLRPSAMKDVVQDLQDRGFDVLRVALTGHRGSMDEYKEVTPTQWRRDVFFGYCLAEQHARLFGGPLVGVGYSLGGLLVEDLLNEKLVSAVHFDAMILYAPAIELRFYTYWVKLFDIFGRHFVLPSVGVEGMTTQSGTPMAAYESLFSLLDEVQDQDFPQSNIPTLVFGDPKDPLVSLTKIREMTERKNFQSWGLVPVTNEGATGVRKYHHLIISEAYVGTNQWREMMQDIGVFLNAALY